jgi:NADH-ubiquinone oxidoreductase chain 5
MITVLSNRVGDVAILLGIAWILNFGGWNFFYVQFILRREDTIFLLVLIILAAMTKRAQIPFSAWLPAAMAAPTPVSALVHSSTLVTAGVYLLIRFNYILGVNNFLFYIGRLTMFMSGLGANYEMDLKKIIALSTLRQLGLMMLTLSIGIVELTFFHLLTHAMFKSMLFLCAGVFIHSMGDIQDIRIMGGLMISCPSTSFYFVIASIALCGFPFLSGFFSRDIILEIYFVGHINLSIYVFIFMATLFTLSYSTRLVYYVFFNNLGSKSVLNLIEEPGILLPKTFLLAITVISGCWIRINMFPLRFVFLPMIIKTSVSIIILLTFLIIFNILGLKINSRRSYYGLVESFMGSMWFLPSLSRVLFIPLFKIGGLFLKLVDQGWLEIFGGQGIIKSLGRLGSFYDFFNLINFKLYIFMIFLGGLFLIVFTLS